MYICHENGKVIAFHEDEKVVDIYIETIYKYHKLKLGKKKIRKKKFKNLYINDDLYLVRYGETFVQSGYTLYLQLQSEQYIEDEKYARDILYRLLETRNVKGKKLKKIKSAISVLEDFIYDDESYIPTLKELENMKMDFAIKKASIPKGTKTNSAVPP